MTTRRIIGIIVFATLFLPSLALSNGGDQRVAEGKYIVTVSRAPFTPHAGEENKMLVSFADILKDELIADDLLVNIRVAKFNGGPDEGNNFLLQKEMVLVKDGVLEFPYTFVEPGLHELFFDFAFASNPKKVFEAPDFLLDVQPALVQSRAIATTPIGRANLSYINIFSFIVVASIGIAVGWFIGSRR